MWRTTVVGNYTNKKIFRALLIFKFLLWILGAVEGKVLNSVMTSLELCFEERILLIMLRDGLERRLCLMAYDF